MNLLCLQSPPALFQRRAKRTRIWLQNHWILFLISNASLQSKESRERISWNCFFVSNLIVAPNGAAGAMIMVWVATRAQWTDHDYADDDLDGSLQDADVIEDYIEDVSNDNLESPKTTVPPVPSYFRLDTPSPSPVSPTSPPEPARPVPSTSLHQRLTPPATQHKRCPHTTGVAIYLPLTTFQKSNNKLAIARRRCDGVGQRNRRGEERAYWTARQGIPSVCCQATFTFKTSLIKRRPNTSDM